MSTADETRYGKPPRRTRFRKRQSGNPAGRLPGRKKEPPYEAVLGQMVTVREDGIERRLTAAEAFLLYLTKLGLDCQRRSKSTPLAGVKMHHLMRFSPALAVVPVVHRRDPRCFV